MTLQRRCYLTPTIEVPPSFKFERPYTVVLAEDIGLFDDGPEQTHQSWAPMLSDTLPSKHGIAFRTWRPSPSTPATLGETQFELEKDLEEIPKLVLLARGPILSWLTTFYLESMSAAGVVLVDPLSFTDDKLAESRRWRRRFMDEYLQYQNVKYPLRRRHQRVLEYMDDDSGWQDVLQLEPGAVPMAIFSTMHIRNSWRLHAHLMAARHSTITHEEQDEDDPEIPVIGLAGPNDPTLAEAIANFCIYRTR